MRGRRGGRGRPWGAAAATLVGALLLGAAGPGPGVLVTVGDVTPTTAVLWLRAPAPGAVTALWGPAGEEMAVAPLAPVPGADQTAKARLERLRPGTRYRYEVRQGGQEVVGEFVTAPDVSVAAPVRFLWSGDLGGRSHCRHVTDGYPIFRALRRVPADFFLFVGDTIYADHACGGPDRVPGYDFVARTLEQFHAKHRYNRADPDVHAFFRGLSVYAIWDDHEVKNDFAGSVEPLMRVGRQAFLDYFPILPPAEEPGRLYRRARWGRALDLFILDTRQYRSPNGDPDGLAKTMLGEAQRRWLLEGLAASDATWKVVVTSVSLSIPTGRGARDSWTSANILGFPEGGKGFATERDRILRALHERGVGNVVFVTADVHHAEVLQHRVAADWQILELVAGPLAAFQGRPRPVDQSLNSRTLFAVGGVETFGEVTVDGSGLTVRLMDVSGRLLFERAFPPGP